MSIADLSLQAQFLKIKEALVPILKAIGNEKRFYLLIELLGGDRTFLNLQSAVDLKKTALSSHLTQLISSQLIQKAKYGVYELSENGRDYLRNIYHAHYQAIQGKSTKLREMEKRKMSTAFLNGYLSKN